MQTLPTRVKETMAEIVRVNNLNVLTLVGLAIDLD